MLRQWKRACAFGAICVACGAAAAPIYRWVDDDGRTHFSETVPKRYEKTATRVMPRDTGPPASASSMPSAPSPVLPPAPSPKASEAAPAQTATPTVPAASAAASAARVQPKDCATLRRLYEESLACFAPYRTVRGGLKAEAFDKCTPVEDPTPVCGYP